MSGKSMFPGLVKGSGPPNVGLEIEAYGPNIHLYVYNDYEVTGLEECRVMFTVDEAKQLIKILNGAIEEASFD